MSTRKPRKPSLPRTDIYTTRRKVTPSRSNSTSRNIRSKNPEINNSPSSNDSNLPDRIRQIDQQMKELFIEESNIDEFSSKLKSALLSSSNFKQQKSSGETFFKFWNDYVQSITTYLRQPISSRLLVFIQYHFNKFKKSISSLIKRTLVFQDSKNKNKIEKNLTEISAQLSQLQQTIDSLNQNSEGENSDTEGQIIERISELATYDQFYHDIVSKYTLFFESTINDKTTTDPLLTVIYRSLKLIVDCASQAPQIESLQGTFLQQINESTDHFEQLFQRPNLHNLTNTEAKLSTRPHRNSYLPRTPQNKTQPVNPNKTEGYKENQANKPVPRKNLNSTPQQNQTFESSSGKDKVIPIDVPSESMDEDTKFVPKQTPQHRIMMTLSKSKYDHLNRRYTSIPHPNLPQRNQNSGHHRSQSHQNDSSSGNKTPLYSPQKEQSRLSTPNISAAKASTQPTTPSPGLSRSLPRQTKNGFKSSPQILDSSHIMTKNKETELLMKIDQVNAHNDELKRRHRELTEQLERTSSNEQIDALNHEIEQLKDVLFQRSAEGGTELELELSNQMLILRELINSLNDTISTITDEIEPMKQINNCLISQSLDDTTVIFDNMRLQKNCNELSEKLRKKQKYLLEVKEQRNKSLMTDEIYNEKRISNDDKIMAFSFINLDSKISKREIDRLEVQLSRLNTFDQIESSHQNPLNYAVTIPFTKDIVSQSRKLIARINQLEQQLSTLRKSRTGEYYSISDQLFEVKSMVSEIKQNDKEKSEQIDHFIAVGDSMQMKRRQFDNYEILKEQSRELQKRYFSIQKNITDDMPVGEKYNIELQMDDIQDQYTIVMMEIERIGQNLISAQENLKSIRKDRTKSRREMLKFADQEYQYVVDNIEAENRVLKLENEAQSLLHNENDDPYLKQITEVLNESAQTKVILNLIDDQSKQFNLELEPNESMTTVQRIDDLKAAVTKLINSSKSKMRQKLLIYNLQKEIESYNS